MDKFLSIVASTVLLVTGSSTVASPWFGLNQKQPLEEKNIIVATSTVKSVKEEIIEHIENTFPEEKKIMSAIARCESGFRHFNDDGSVVIGRETPDVGLFQVSPKYWEKEAEKLGHDIYSLEGNLKMARHIYDVQGLSAWGASFSCWKKTN